MFWGLIMEPRKKYSQVVKKPFHISMAALDLTSSDDNIVQVMCATEDHKHLLCTLQKDKYIQCPLDLNFDVGTKISFITNGNSHVHLSGYLIQDDWDGLDDDAEEEEDENEISTSNVLCGKRPKQPCSSNEQLAPEVDITLSGFSTVAPTPKKLKEMFQNISNDYDSEDDSDVDLDALMDEASDDEEIEEEESDNDGEEEELEEEEYDDEEEDVDLHEAETEEESDSEEEEVPVKTKMNGTASKKEKQEAKTQAADKTPSKKNDSNNQKQAKTPQKKTIEGGVIIEDIRPGNGPEAKAGKMVTVRYEGRLKKDNKMFDSSTKGFNFRLGRGEVIKGWDVGVAGMKIGGKRRITCPPNVAYGKKGSPPTIPPNSTLVFEVELLKVK